MMSRFFLVLLILALSFSSFGNANHVMNTLTPAKIRKILPEPNPEALKIFKSQYLDPILIERVSGSPGNKIVQKFIKDSLSSLGWTIEEDRFIDKTPLGQKEFVNIIATHNPTAPKKLLLAAHFDSKFFKNFPFLGATDSAASCALMLELAAAMTPWLNSQERNKDYTLQLVFFDGEEAFVSWTATDSIYGARHLAKKWAGEVSKKTTGEVSEKTTGEVSGKTVIEEIDLLILLDLIGAKDPLIMNYFERTSKAYERLQRIESRLRKASLMNLPVGLTSFFASKGPLRSPPNIGDDHTPFLERGVPVVHVIPYPFPEFWHKAEDDETAVDMGTLDDMGRIMKVFVCEYLDLL